MPNAKVQGIVDRLAGRLHRSVVIDEPHDRMLSRCPALAAQPVRPRSRGPHCFRQRGTENVRESIIIRGPVEKWV